MDPIALLCLLGLSVVVLMLCDKLGWSKIPCLVFASLAVTELGIFPGGIHLEPDVLLGIFLPALLFFSGLSITLHELKENALKTIGFALFGTMVTLALFAWGGINVLGMGIAQALVLAAAAVPTDPPATINIMEEKEAPAELAIITEFESLFNDGTGVVFFSIFSGMLVGEAISLSHGLVEFTHEAIFGLLFGAMIGAFFGYITSFYESKEIEFALTLLGSYGVYVLALAVGVSPVLAIVGSAIALRNMADSVDGWSPEIENYVFDNWKNLSDFANVFIFMLVGGHIGSFLSLQAFLPGLLLSVILFLARAVSIYVIGFLLGFVEQRMPRAWMDVLIVGGLRGGLGIAMILTLPVSPMRDLLLARLLWIVLISLLFQSALITPVLKYHKLIEEDSPKKQLHLLNEEISSLEEQLLVWEEAQVVYAVALDETETDDLEIWKIKSELTSKLDARKKLLRTNESLKEEVLQEVDRKAIHAGIRRVRRSGLSSRFAKTKVLKSLYARLSH